MLLRSSVLTGVSSLENIPSAPDREGEDEHDSPSSFCSCSSPDVWEIECEAEDKSPKHLSQPIKRAVERASTSVELREIDVVELIGVEPIRRKEHGEKEYHVGITPKCLPKAEDLRLPRWVSH